MAPQQGTYAGWHHGRLAGDHPGGYACRIATLDTSKESFTALVRGCIRGAESADLHHLWGGRVGSASGDRVDDRGVVLPGASHGAGENGLFVGGGRRAA